MTTELHLELWNKARVKMRQTFGSELYDRWFSGLSLLSIEDDVIGLGVANNFVLDWIRAKYLGRMTEVFREVAERDVSLKLRVDPKLFRQRREDQKRAFPEGERGGSGTGGVVAVPPAGVRGSETLLAGREAFEPTLDNLVVGSGNQLAYSATLEVLARPGEVYNPFFVHGALGVGKTHLLKAIDQAFRRGGRCRPRDRRHGSISARDIPGRISDDISPLEGLIADVEIPANTKVRYQTGERFFNHFVASIQDGSLRRFRDCYRSLDVLILDDVHLLLSKKKTQLEFLHTFNSLVDAGKQIIVASDVPPKDLNGMDPALVGRFLSGLVTKIKRPDYSTRLDIVRHRAQRLRSRLEPNVLELLAESVRGNARELIGALMQLDAEALLSREPLDAEAARTILAEIFCHQESRITLKRIHELVAKHYGLPAEVLVSSNRERSVSRARQVAMYLSRRLTQKSLVEIGKYYGNRNHTTVKSAISKIDRLVQSSDSAVLRDVQIISDLLEGN